MDMILCILRTLQQECSWWDGVEELDGLGGGSVLISVSYGQIHTPLGNDFDPELWSPT